MCDFPGCENETVVTVECPHYREMRCSDHCTTQRCELHEQKEPADLAMASYVNRCWHAPQEVNPQAAPEHMMCREIVEAGTRTLRSEHVLIVIRRNGERFTASLGIGSHTDNLKGSFKSTGEAYNEARRIQQKRIMEELKNIKEARGGTLNWGMDVTPAEPKVIYRDESGSAWEGLKNG